MVSVGVSTALAGGLAVLSFPPNAMAAPAEAPGEAQAIRVPQPTASRTARTSAKEARRVDRVKKPKLKWYTCVGLEHAQCATARLPRDYDRPAGRRLR
jgi:hypothetical protein